MHLCFKEKVENPSVFAKVPGRIETVTKRRKFLRYLGKEGFEKRPMGARNIDFLI